MSAEARQESDPALIDRLSAVHELARVGMKLHDIAAMLKLHPQAVRALLVASSKTLRVNNG